MTAEAGPCPGWCTTAHAAAGITGQNRHLGFMHQTSDPAVGAGLSKGRDGDPVVDVELPVDRVLSIAAAEELAEILCELVERSRSGR